MRRRERNKEKRKGTPHTYNTWMLTLNLVVCVSFRICKEVRKLLRGPRKNFQGRECRTHWCEELRVSDKAERVKLDWKSRDGPGGRLEKRNNAKALWKTHMEIYYCGSFCIHS